MKSLCVILTALASTATALTFNCRFLETEWMGIGVNYQCYTEQLSIESTQYVTSATGTHMENKTNNDVAAIHVRNCKDLAYIPKGLLNVFPNLIAIYLEGCGIATLNGTELNEYPKMELFALERSPLEYIPGNFFSQNPNLYFVSFTNNKIKSTGRDLLTNLTKLSEAYFDNNICINANATIMREALEFKEKLNEECSFASEMYKSVGLTLLLSALAYFGKYLWIN